MKAWNVKYKYETIPTIKGNDYEIGFALGELFHGEYKKLDKYKKNLKDPKVNEYLSLLQPFLRANCRPAYDEICGRADGAKIDVKLLFASLCQEELSLNSQEHCTSIMVSTENNKVLAHNEDGDFNKKNARVVRVERKGSGAHYEIAEDNSLSSSTIFVGKDLVFSTNSINFNHYDLKNVPTFAFYKMCSCCKTFEDLLTVVKNTPITSACGLNVCDVPNKKFYYIEKVLDKFDLKPIDGVNVHTNHLLASKFADLKPEKWHKTSTSLSRRTIANDLIKNRKDLNVEEVYKIITYYGSCDFNSVMSKKNTGYDCLTFGTYVLDLKNKLSFLHVHNKKNTVFELDLPKF